uniref:Uncharacterized protein n=1 Tax=Timema poppense TaxID=170557 RepID=A0A7R9D1U5_TIMPO|nr:unnamed protein product [Timema poppensis]
MLYSKSCRGDLGAEDPQPALSKNLVVFTTTDPRVSCSIPGIAETFIVGAVGFLYRGMHLWLDIICSILSLDVIVENFGDDVHINNFTTHCQLFIHNDEVHIGDRRIRSKFLPAVEAEGKSKCEIQDTPNNRMQCIKSVLIDLFTRTIKEAFPDVPDPPVPVVPSQFCDYQCNSALPITQLLKAQGQLNLR